MLIQLFEQYRAFLWGVPSEDPRSCFLLEVTRESRNVCASVSGTQYIGLGRQPTLDDTKRCGTWFQSPRPSLPKDTAPDVGFLIQYIQPYLLSRSHSALGREWKASQRVLHPFTYLLTSLLRHSYNLAIPVHHFYSIIKFWASHHCHSKSTCQTCRVKGDFAIVDPKGLSQ